MFHENAPHTRTGARKYFLYSWLVFAAVLCYLGWVFYSRWRENQEIDRKVKAQQDVKNNAEERRVFEMLGGNRFEILNFYASPRSIRRGDSAQLCYGVSNAKSVRLDPPEGRVWPAVSRCFDVAPKKETTYTLTAIDASGNVLTQKVTLKID